MLNNKIKLIPIIFFEVFLSFTVLLFAFGPWEWPVKNNFLLYSYLIGAQIFLFIGYLLGIRKIRGKKTDEIPIKFINLSIILNLVMAIPLIYVRSGGNYSYVLEGFTNPGKVYNSSREGTVPYNIIEYIDIVLAPITWSLLPCIVFYWNNISKKLKIIGIITIVLAVVLPYVASGTNKGLFDIIIVVISIRGFLLLSQRKNRKLRISKKNFLGFLSVIIGIFIVISFFSKNIAQRQNVEDDDIESMTINTRSGAQVSQDFMRNNLPVEVKLAIISLSSYISQGYFGLSLALQEPFVPTYGLGSSKFFTWLGGEKILGVDMSKYTYLERVSQNSSWEAGITWSSIYPWLASDFTFLGSYIIIFIIGWLLGSSWVSMIYSSDKWAAILFSLLCIMIFYFSANNQVLQTGTTFSAFFVALFLWLKKSIFSNLEKILN